MEAVIRPARMDDAHLAIPLICDAIGEIANRITGEKELEKMKQALVELFQREDNMHSYRYTYIAEIDNQIAGIVVMYPGHIAADLDSNLSRWLTEKGASVTQVDAECLSDEFYINTVCTMPAFRGNGIGTLLLHHAEIVAKQIGMEKTSLNVDIQKTSALKLYERIGYTIASPWTIIGEPFHHMVKVI